MFVLAEAGSETGVPAAPVLGSPPPAERASTATALAALLARGAATVVDLSLSPNYRKGHIPGAWFAIRSRLERALPNIPVQGELVLTSEDGVLAGLAVAEASALTTMPVRYLDGGNAAWQAAGLPLSTEPHMADDPIDVWLKPYERAGDTKGAMSEYLSWEVDLLAAHRARRHLPFQPLTRPCRHGTRKQLVTAETLTIVPFIPTISTQAQCAIADCATNNGGAMPPGYQGRDNRRAMFGLRRSGS